MKEVEDEIIEEFSLFEDQMDRYEYIIDIGKKLPPLEKKYQVNDFLVQGCQSKVWLHAFAKEDKIFYEADSNTAITKGIIALLIRVLSGRDPKEVVNYELTFIDGINLRSHLSSQRSNGLSSMIHRMKAYASAFSK